MKILKFLAMLAAMLVPLTCANVVALGVAPGTITLFYEGGKEKTVNVKVVNDEGIDLKFFVYAEGEFEKWVDIKEHEFEMRANESEKTVSYTVKMPDDVKRPGEHITKIVFRAMPRKNVRMGGTDISSIVALVSKLVVNVPFPGKYAEIRLLSPNFKRGRASNFAIEATNLGKKKIIDGVASIDIYTPLNEKVETLVSHPVDIEPKEKKLISVEWLPKVSNGRYLARATFVYNGRNAVDEREFFVGEQDVSIDSISVRNFRLGGIAKFDIMLSNGWNEPVKNVYADYSIEDKEGRTYVEGKTPFVDLPANGKGLLEAYWNTEKVKEGNYILKLRLHFLGKTKENAYDITVERNAIKVGMWSGRFVEKGAGGVEETLKAIVYVLIFLVAFNIFIYLKVVKKKK